MRLSTFLIVSTLALALAFMTARAFTSWSIADAVAQGATEARDAGTTSSVDVPDPVAHPAESISEAKRLWNAGAWQGIVFVVLVVAGAIHRRTEPKDEDGDGQPDPKGWEGKVWSLTGALAMVGVPLLSVATHVAGATWNAVAIGLVAAGSLVLFSKDPVKGSAIKPTAPVL